MFCIRLEEEEAGEAAYFMFWQRLFFVLGLLKKCIWKLIEMYLQRGSLINDKISEDKKPQKRKFIRLSEVIFFLLAIKQGKKILHHIWLTKHQNSKSKPNNPNICPQVTTTHRLVGPDGVQEGGVVSGADFRQDEGQKAAVAIQLAVHEKLKVKQVSDDVHGCEKVNK